MAYGDGKYCGTRKETEVYGDNTSCVGYTSFYHNGKICK